MAHYWLQRQHVVNVHEVNYFSYNAAGARQVAEALATSVHNAAVAAAAAATVAPTAADASAEATGGVDGVPGEQGGSCEGRFGITLKLRFNLGKQLFYRVPKELWEEATGHGLDLQGLQVRAQGLGLMCRALSAAEYDNLFFGPVYASPSSAVPSGM